MVLGKEKFMKIAAFIAMAFFIGLAVNAPLVMFGASRSTLLIIDVILAGLWLANQDRDTESIFVKFWIYGFVFSLWSVIGLLVVIVLALLSFDMHLPNSAYVIAGTGLFGVLREISKAPVND